MMTSFANITRRVLLGLCLVVFAALPSLAAKPIKVTPEQVASINAVSDYLNSFKTMQGEFTQISPKGNLSRGVFYISKPGKMRFQYAPPNPYLIVADGRWLTIKNTVKEKGDQFPLSQTPLRLVLGSKIDLLKDTEIMEFEEQDGLIAVTLEDRDSTLGGGRLTLVYDQNRMALQQWVVIDGKGRRTTVTLENIVAGVDPDPKLFVVKINRKERLR
jgi:outer membrane lipoprotein-sorting protein